MEQLKCAICNETISKKNLWKHLVNAHSWSVVASSAAPGGNASIRESSSNEVDVAKTKRKSSINKSPEPKLIAWAKNQTIQGEHNELYQKFLQKSLAYLQAEQARLVATIEQRQNAPLKEQSLKRLVLITRAAEHIKRKAKEKEKAKLRAKALSDMNSKLRVNNSSSSDLMDQYRGGKRLVCSGGLPSLGKRK